MKGFYLVGCFDKGRKAEFMILPQSQKPFKIDSLRGEIEPKGIPTCSKRRYFFADKWEFIEGHTISEISEKGAKENPALANQVIILLNEIWAMWCEEHHRKYFKLFDEVRVVGEVRV